jgi:hypothetical protein
VPSDRQNQDQNMPREDRADADTEPRNADNEHREDRAHAREDGDRRRNVWVLDTETKGTGANMVPLESVLRKPGQSGSVPGFGFRKLERRPEEPEPPAPHRFRVVDVMTQEVLADDVDARAAVQALEDMRSVVDVLVYVWEPESERWRMLTFGETEALWGYRGQTGRLA